MGKQKDFVALSILTMYQQRATVCSIGMVKVKNNEVVDEYNTLVSPPSDIVSKAFVAPKDMHGIDESRTAGCPTFIELINGIEDFIEDLPLVVYNGVTERFAFIRSMEYYRAKGIDIQSYLESVRFIELAKMDKDRVLRKEYDTLLDARQYVELYKSIEEDDVLYPKIKEKKRPDVTQEYMAAVKRKEKVAKEVYDEFDYSQTKHPDHPYYGYGVFITGEAEFFSSKTDMYLYLRNEFGIHPRKNVLTKSENILVQCRDAGQGRIDKANAANQIIINEEDLFEEAIFHGFDVPKNHLVK